MRMRAAREQQKEQAVQELQVLMTRNAQLGQRLAEAEDEHLRLQAEAAEWASLCKASIRANDDLLVCLAQPDNGCKLQV